MSFLCANPECTSEGEQKTPLRIAASFVCAFFGLPLEKNKVYKVCETCYDTAEKHQITLVEMLKQNKNILEMVPKKLSTQLVYLDEEDADDQEIADKAEKFTVQEGFEESIQNLIEKFNFKDRVEESAQYFDKKSTENGGIMAELDVLHSDAENKLDAFEKELYAVCKIQTRHVEAIDIDSEGKVSKHSVTPILAEVSPVPTVCTSVQLLPVGIFKHTVIKKHHVVYAMHASLLAPWEKCIVTKVTRTPPETSYAVRFEAAGSKSRSFPLKYLAYSEASQVQLTVGARVIAHYAKGKEAELPQHQFSYHAGVIAESPKNLNRYRYLIFFDDGYTQYCIHEQIRMVCHSSSDVWHDIHPKMREFVSDYLKRFPERAMVKLQCGQTVKIELDGRWILGKVKQIDASLAYIHYVSEDRFEWIYRGSTRLYTLFQMLKLAEAKKNQRITRPIHNLALANRNRKNIPYVEYTRGEVDPIPSSVTPPLLPVKSSSPSDEVGIRAVARKSTGSRTKPVDSSTAVLSCPTRLKDHGKCGIRGNIKSYPNETYQDVLFEPHQCGPKCIADYPYEEGDCKNQNPLAVPMLYGWSREMTKQSGRPGHGRKKMVLYRAPCGRRMRNMDELHRYLRLTQSLLSVELFCFDKSVHCLDEFEPDLTSSLFIEDISNGKENVLVSCVNSVDNDVPAQLDYCTERIPQKDVDLNLDVNFLACCDCTDDCQVWDDCACWKLTEEAAGRKANDTMGYHHRRLINGLVPTGIYECNSQCSCRKTCLNRVAQRPLQLRLQLFRTEKCGWGVRCLNDIPKGELICVYTGQIITGQNAEEDGMNLGDEYFADLDLIECAENNKEGYESGVDETDPETVKSSPDESECDSSSAVSECSDRPKKKPKLQKEKKPDSSLDISTGENSTRNLYGPNQSDAFVVDSKTVGNIGRYLNHSCEPNVFAQSVFVDTHDLRFHWIALFASSNIRAGTELTWNYNYVVGSVPDKVLYCQCGSKNCRGRML